MQDLFEKPELLPKNVQKILSSFDIDKDPYKQCKRMEKKLKPLGYSFDWGLDGIPYDLVKEPTKTPIN
jgi:hypothetical protein